MKRTMAMILAGGEGERLSILSQERAKPAVPFGGKYRIIDFSLSNCVNSDITDILVLTQYNPRSLNDHIGVGRPWDLDRNRGGVKRRRRSEFPTTKSDESAIAAPATSGLRRPAAASGRAATL